MITQGSVSERLREHAATNGLIVTNTIEFSSTHIINKEQYGNDAVRHCVASRAYEQIMDQIQPTEEFETAFNECISEVIGLLPGMSAIPAILKLKSKLDLRDRNKP